MRSSKLKKRLFKPSLNIALVRKPIRSISSMIQSSSTKWQMDAKLICGENQRMKVLKDGVVLQRLYDFTGNKAKQLFSDEVF
jgi:hypothetical protein